MADPKSKNIFWHGANVTSDERFELISQKGCVLGFTGLSGSGKSTVARRVEELILRRGKVEVVIDGHRVRSEHPTWL